MSFRRGNIWRLVFGTYAVLWLTPLLQAQQLPRFTEQVQVTRILIDARVINDGGTPVLDLGSDDFEVKIGGKLAPIESVSWVSGHIGTPEDALKRSAVNDPAPLPQGIPGRLGHRPAGEFRLFRRRRKTISDHLRQQVHQRTARCLPPKAGIHREPGSCQWPAQPHRQAAREGPRLLRSSPGNTIRVRLRDLGTTRLTAPAIQDSPGAERQEK